MDFEYLNYQESLNSMAPVVNNSPITPAQVEAYAQVGIAIEEVVEEPKVEEEIVEEPEKVEVKASKKKNKD